MAGIILVLGTQGAGKSSVLSALSEKIVNMGDEMLKRAEKEFGIKDRDKLRQLPNYAEKSEEWRKEILKELAESKEGIVLLDTHASIKSSNRYTPGITIEDMELIKGSAKGIIYIDAPTSEIIQRREKDKGIRSREADAPEEIEAHKAINLSLASFFSAYLNIPLFIIYNKNGMLEKAQEQAKEALKQMK